ncbi:hypothetical protein [Vulcanococcus limneticus]|uniref:hypothetical protein n=1 Tax=Vulcanococcus limneticus TaxID=2170428 RepID=UPI000B98EE17|nr:hypothetical protein [Vulcanococcus limneticus]
MRGREWQWAAHLLDAVLQGPTELTRARLYRAVCSLHESGGVDSDTLQQLVGRHRQEGQEQRGTPPLDVLVQDPTTCLLELLLLCQGADPELLDQLYDAEGRRGTTGLTLLLQPERGPSTIVVLSEWLAEAQLAEWSQEGWLVVDATAEPVGELGRGSQLKSPNVPTRVLVGLAQVLGRAAVAGRGGSAGLTPEAAQQRFLARDDGRLVNPDSGEPRWQYVTSGVLVEHPYRKAFERSRSTGTWQLIPPYVVVQRDSSTLQRQAAGRFQ